MYLCIDIVCIYVCRLRAADHMHGLVTSVAESSRVLGYGCHCQVTATHCNTLLHTATHYNTLQHTATRRNTLQHAATHCNTPQHTATYCNTPQHTATYCNTPQHTATHCNTLQHTATQWKVFTDQADAEKRSIAAGEGRRGAESGTNHVSGSVL